MQKKTRTFLQNSAILLFSAIFIEILINGAVYSYNQVEQAPTTSKKIVLPADSETKIILCVGESTTAAGAENSYPSKLQNKLDQYYGPNKYFVINDGSAETNSALITQDMKRKIQEYRPDFVITMMGINDFWALKTSMTFWDFFNPSIFYKLLKKKIRVALGADNENKLWENISGNVQERIEPIPKPVLPVEPRSAKFIELLSLARKALYDKNFKELEEILTKISKVGAFNSEAYFLKGIVELEKGNVPKSIEYFQRYVDIHKTYQAANRVGVTYFIKDSGTESATRDAAKHFLNIALTYRPTGWSANKYLGFISVLEKDNESALRFFSTAYENGLREFDMLIALGLVYREKGDFKKEEEILTSGLHEKGQVIWTWISLLKFYIIQERFEEAEEFYALVDKKFPGHPRVSEIKAELLKAQGKSSEQVEEHNLINFYDFPSAKVNYLKTADILKQNKIKHVVMQYPLRPIDPLKTLLADYKEVVFVDNEKIFRDALTKHQYEEVFIDRFGWDFGRTSSLGSEMISENIIKTLQSEKLLPSL